MRITWVRVILAVVAVSLSSVSGVRTARAFGEDATSVTPSVSTHHLYLTRALAACAGIPSTADEDPAASPAEAELIAIYDQMTDTRAHRAWSLCDAQAFAAPAPTDVGCAAGTTLAWPTYRGDDLSTCFTARTGVYSTVFHFPTPANLASLRSWGLGTTTTLVGEASFAFGSGGDVFAASCYRQMETTIDTGAVRAGTPEAFGIYLHAVADEWSHRFCCEHWGTTASPPWCMHTRIDEPAGCIATMHRLEYGCPDEDPPPMAPALDATPFVDHTVDAADAVFTELLAYSAQRGYSPVLTSFDDRGGWLRRQVERFGSRTAIGSSAARIALANEINVVCRNMPVALCPPDVAVADELLTCSYPLTALCEAGGADAGSGGVDASGTDASGPDASGPDASGPDASGMGAGAATGCRCGVARSAPGTGALALGAMTLAALAARQRRWTLSRTKQETT